MSSHGRTVNPIPFSKHTDAGRVVSHQTIDLGGSEESLSLLNFADDMPANVRN